MYIIATCNNWPPNMLGGREFEYPPGYKVIGMYTLFLFVTYIICIVIVGLRKINGKYKFFISDFLVEL
jgi:hypothetical protein